MEELLLHFLEAGWFSFCLTQPRLGYFGNSKAGSEPISHELTQTVISPEICRNVFCTVIEQTISNIKNVKMFRQTLPPFLNDVIINVMCIIFTAFILCNCQCTVFFDNLSKKQSFFMRSQRSIMKQ